MDTHKHFYSRMLPVLTGAVFIYVLWKSFHINIEDFVDASIYVTAITSSAAIWGSSIIWYSKKRLSENAFLLRMQLYKESSKQRLWFNRKMVELMEEYRLDENDMMRLNEFGEIDDMMNNAMNDVIQVVDTSQSEADQPNELQNFGI